MEENQYEFRSNEKRMRKIQGYEKENEMVEDSGWLCGRCDPEIGEDTKEYGERKKFKRSIWTRVFSKRSENGDRKQ